MSEKSKQAESEHNMCVVSSWQRVDTAETSRSLITRANADTNQCPGPPLCDSLKGNTDKIDGARSMTLSIDDRSMTRLLKLWCDGLFSCVFALPHHLCVNSIPWQTRTQKMADASVPPLSPPPIHDRAENCTDGKKHASSTYRKGIWGVE